MAPRRFHVEDLSAATIRLAGDEARHAHKVLRLGPGDHVTLFDGRGQEADGRIVAAARDALDVEILARRQAGAATAELVIACAVPKGDRADWLVEKCAELGVIRLIPLLAARGLVRPGEAKIDRWRRKAVEASKQSRQMRAMSIDAPATLSEALTACPAAAVYYCDADPAHPALPAGIHASATKSALILIGPEGGFTDAEITAIRSAGGRPARLAESILRVETAAVAAAAHWAAHRLTPRA